MLKQRCDDDRVSYLMLFLGKITFFFSIIGVLIKFHHFMITGGSDDKVSSNNLSSKL